MQGVYVPPHLRHQHAAAIEKLAQSRGAGSTAAVAPEVAMQQEMWQALNRSLLGIVNKVTVSNIHQVAVECLRENVSRGRGLFCKAIIRAQSHHADLSNVFASLVAVINSKVPAVGHLLGRRLIFNFKRYLRRGESGNIIAAARFIVQLSIQNVVPSLLVLKILASLLCSEKPTEDDIEVAMAIFRDAFKFLESSNPQAFRFILGPVRDLLGRSGHAQLSVKSCAVLEKALELVGQWQLKKDSTPFLDVALDIVDEDDQICHEDLDLDDDYDPEAHLDKFTFDPKYDETEAEYEAFSEYVLADFPLNQVAPAGLEIPDFDDDGDDEEEAGGALAIAAPSHPHPGHQVVPSPLTLPPHAAPDSVERGGPGLPKALDAPVLAVQGLTPEQVSALRKELFLILKSSMRGEEVAHKILTHVTEGHESVVAKMLLESSYHESSFDKMYGIVASCLCSTAARYQQAFDKLFAATYADVEALSMKEIDIAGKFFGYLLVKNVLHWTVLRIIKITAEDTNDSNRNFIRVLFQYLGEEMGVGKLGDKIKRDVVPSTGLFPRDSLERARFAINFFGAVSRKTADLSLLTVPLAQWYEAEKSKLVKRPRPEDAL